MGEAEGGRVFLTGGTGFVGGHVARRLLERGHRVRALVRERARADPLRELGAEIVEGDVLLKESLKGALEGCDAVVHLVGIIKERPPQTTFENVHVRGTAHVVDAAKRAAVESYVHMSALGARPEGGAYHRTKHQGEEVVRRSELPYVIFRPSVIVGRDGEFTRMLIRLLRLFPITPVLGDGRYRLQPVDVTDVSQAFALAVERKELRDETLSIAGPHKLTYNRIIEIVGEELGYRRPKLHVPLAFVRPFVELATRWRLPTPVTSDQLRMLLEENVLEGEANPLRDVLDIEPTSFRSVLRRIREARQG